MRFSSVPLCLAALLVAGPAVGQDKPWTPPSYDKAFNKVWRDGNAELASYKLTYIRYGEARHGTAVAITVTEPFDPTARVKADSIRKDTYGVIKLNLVEDFQTGIYDYNLMTSVFVATEPANGLPAGSATKVSYSSQEWCGHVYQQALFSRAKRGTPGVRQTLHSYFEGEADQELELDHPAGGIAEDALMLWARGLAGPKLKPGESIEVPVYPSMTVQRQQHATAEWKTATLSRGSASESFGDYTVDTFTADVAGRQYTFLIDTAPDSHRKLIKLSRNDGYELEFVKSDRLPYWNMKDKANEKDLKDIGLKPRGPGMM